MNVWTDVSPDSLQLKLWEKISLVAGDDTDAGLYEARVEDFEEDEIHISQPILQKGRTLLRESLPVTVRATRQDAIYEFESIVHRLPGDPSGRVSISAPRALRRIQRRLFVRIDVRSTVSYALVERVLTDSTTVSNGSWRVSDMLDISGGGALIATSETIDMNQMLILSSPLFAEVGISEFVLARATRKTERDGEPAVGVEFVLSEEVLRMYHEQELAKLPSAVRKFGKVAQNKLVNFIFNQQIKTRQNGQA